ncbi:MFS transporter [Streptacidiphilus sp. EB103A]|uniref:MFS transporter n=1 Tax=Streptacidiphilus sp. EB103A TaxID=3156275 RepID=UPI00351997AD
MGYLRLLQRRSVLVLWLAETLSVFGDRFFTLALMWTVLATSGPVAMGVLVVTESIPHLLIGTFGRRLVARLASFRALSLVDAAQIGVVGALPWLWHLLGFPAAVAVIMVIGTADALADPTRSALVPELVAEDQVQHVNGLMDLTGRFTWILGPGAAAVLLAFLPAERLFLIDAGTFAVSAVALRWLARQPRWLAAGVTPTAAPSPAPAPKAWPTLRRHPALACALGLHGTGEFLYAITTVGVPILLASRLHTRPDAYALVVTCMGAGSVVGNLLVGNLALPKRFLHSYCASWLVRGAVLAGYALARDLAAVLVLTALSSLTVPWGSIQLRTALSRLPAGERLRLITVDSAGLHLAGMTGMCVLPALAAFAPGSSFLGCGIAMVALAVTGWTVAVWLARHSRTAGTAPDCARRRRGLAPAQPCSRAPKATPSV